MNIIQRIYKKLRQRSRLSDYEDILKYAVNNGYSLCSLHDWYQSDKQEKQFVLRHDVDIDCQGARRMFEIEKSMGVTSTYYFRNATQDLKLISEMQEASFETGLHYETIADYCKLKKIYSSKNLKDEDYANCKKLLTKDIEDWKSKYGDLFSICAHGDKRNRLLKVPNRILFDKDMREKTSVLFDACDVDLMDLVDQYISDSSIINNHKWKQGISPFDAIDSGSDTIMLLTHPTHWNYNFFKNIKALYKGFLEDNLNYVYAKRRLKEFL